MKKAGLLLVFISFLLAISCFLGPANKLASLYLSQKCVMDVRLGPLHLMPGGQVSFSGFAMAKTGKDPAWLEAQKGYFSVGDIFQSPAHLNISLENAKTPWTPDLISRADLPLGEKRGVKSIRVLRADGRDFRLSGSVKIQAGLLRKLDTRILGSPHLFSGWPKNLVQKMSVDKNGWRATILSYGGSTWTLRGSGRPLLQFSGHFTPSGDPLNMFLKKS